MHKKTISICLPAQRHLVRTSHITLENALTVIRTTSRSIDMPGLVPKPQGRYSLKISLFYSL